MGDSVEPSRALVKACRDGSLEEARRCIDAGADPNQVGDHGLTPLLWIACAREREAIIRFLLERGADVNYLGFSEGTALMLAAYVGESHLLSL